MYVHTPLHPQRVAALGNHGNTTKFRELFANRRFSFHFLELCGLQPFASLGLFFELLNGLELRDIVNT